MKPNDTLKGTGTSKNASKQDSIGAVKAKGSKKISETKSAGSGFRLAEQSSNLESRPNKAKKGGNPYPSKPM